MRWVIAILGVGVGGAFAVALANGDEELRRDRASLQPHASAARSSTPVAVVPPALSRAASSTQKQASTSRQTTQSVHPRARNGGRRAASATAAKPEPSVLGFDFRPVRRPLHEGANYPDGSGTLALLDAKTLRPVSRRLALRGYVFGWDSSPDGTRLALGTGEHGRIKVVDIEHMRTLAAIRLPVEQPLFYMRWLAPDRLAVVTDYADAVAWELDAGDGAVQARHDLDGRVLAVEQLPDGLAALLAPSKGAGGARLAFLRAGAAPQIVELADVRAGYPRRPEGYEEVPDDAPPDLIPGLAVGDGAAWVVDPQAFRIARVDLASADVTMHDVVTARTSKGGPYSTRHARWLGDGLLAVSGSEGGARDRPFGLRVVDTTTWRARVIAANANVYELQSGAGALLYPRSQSGRLRPPTLFAYEPNGRRRFAFRPRFGLTGVDVAGNLAYVHSGNRPTNRRIHVIDLRSGRAVATRRLPRGTSSRPLRTRELILLTRP